MEAILDGVRHGAAISLLVGPVMLLIITESVVKGKWAGLKLASGVWTADTALITLLYWGLSHFFTRPAYTAVMTLAGFALLFTFGLAYLISARRNTDASAPGMLRFAGNTGNFVKGLGVTLFNPFSALFWVGMMGLLQVRGYAFREEIVFLAALVGTMVAADLVKVFLADYLQGYFTPKNLRLFKMLSGALLIVLALILLVRGFVLLK